MAGFLSKEGTGDENKEFSLASIIVEAYNAGKDVVVVPNSSRNRNGATGGGAHKVRGNSPKTLTLVLDVPAIDFKHASPPCEGFHKMEESATIKWKVQEFPPGQGFSKTETSLGKKKTTEDFNDEKGGDEACNKMEVSAERKKVANNGNNENGGDESMKKMEMFVEEERATDDSENGKGVDAVVHPSSGHAMNSVFSLLLLTMVTTALVIAWFFVGYYYNNNMLAFTFSNTDVDIDDGDDGDDHQLGNDDGAFVFEKFLRGAASVMDE